MRKCSRCLRMFDGFGARCDECIEGRSIPTRRVNLATVKSDAIITNFEPGNMTPDGGAIGDLESQATIVNEWVDLEEGCRQKVALIDEQEGGNS